MPGISIQQAAEQTGLTTHTLRYYEQIGLLPSIQRAANGYSSLTSSDDFRLTSSLMNSNNASIFENPCRSLLPGRSKEARQTFSPSVCASQIRIR
jgi:hypothetical protein